MIASARAGEVRARIFADADFKPDLKLFALAVVHLLESPPPQKVKEFRKESWAYRALRLAGHTGTTEELTRKLRWIVRDDVPKYRLPKEPERVCVGVMLRPAGAPCARRATHVSTRPNPLTGERDWIGACSNARHFQAYESARQESWTAWRANGEPAPKPNSGGVLLRHFERGIEPLYAWADREYTRGDVVTPPVMERDIAGVVSLADYRRAPEEAR